MTTKVIRPLIESVGIVTSAPATAEAQGYSFIQIDGGVVYCSRGITDKAGISARDIGSTATVRHFETGEGRRAAAWVEVSRQTPDFVEPSGNVQALANMVAEFDVIARKQDEVLNALVGALMDMGCTYPAHLLE